MTKKEKRKLAKLKYELWEIILNNMDKDKIEETKKRLQPPTTSAQFLETYYEVEPEFRCFIEEIGVTFISSAPYLTRNEVLKRIRIEIIDLLNKVIYKHEPIKIYRQIWKVEAMIREYNIRIGGSMSLVSILSPSEKKLLGRWLNEN